MEDLVDILVTTYNTEEKYLRKNFKYKGCLGDMHEDKNLVKKLDELLDCCNIEIDTDDEYHIYVDL